MNRMARGNFRRENILGGEIVGSVIVACSCYCSTAAEHSAVVLAGNSYNFEKCTHTQGGKTIARNSELVTKSNIFGSGYLDPNLAVNLHPEGVISYNINTPYNTQSHQKPSEVPEEEQYQE